MARWWLTRMRWNGIKQAGLGWDNPEGDDESSTDRDVLKPIAVSICFWLTSIRPRYSVNLSLRVPHLRYEFSSPTKPQILQSKSLQVGIYFYKRLQDLEKMFYIFWCTKTKCKLLKKIQTPKHISKNIQKIDILFRIITLIERNGCYSDIYD